MKKVPLLLRANGVAVQIEKELWHWELKIILGKLEIIHLTSEQKFSSRDLALADLDREVPRVMKGVTEAAGLPDPTIVEDLNTGAMSEFNDWADKPVKVSGGTFTPDKPSGSVVH